MDDILNRLSSLMVPEMMDEAVGKQFLRDMLSGEQSPNIRMLPSNENNEDAIAPSMIFADRAKSFTGEAMKVRFPPPQILPCANTEAAKYKTCANPGTMACSQCRLVSYCSKDCQKNHWGRHKRDCKDPMRSDSWSPIWEREGRPPCFLTDMQLPDEYQREGEEKFSVGMSLWGNTPAMDIINLNYNEKDDAKDFSLAFIASGDLRHVLTTVNGLPLTYSGKLSLLVNDMNPAITCRNVALLLILGTIEDEALAVDMAIHFWYSIFMPGQYKLRLSVLIANFLLQACEGRTAIPLGPTSTFFCHLPKMVLDFFNHSISSHLSVGDVQEEYDRVRNAQSRRDFRDRMYLGLRPSHRVAFQAYRRFGIVLPLGAFNAHFNSPNPSLFSPGGKWMQTDYADPLEGWDMTAILAAGKAHGAQPEDIYGCLYFYLSQELRNFIKRIRKFKIFFTISTLDAGRLLPMAIQDGALSCSGIPGSIRFDRVAVSNILDKNYVGIRKVLTGWAPLLARTPHAAVVGYFMNWFVDQPDGCSTHADNQVAEDVVSRLLERKTGGRSPTEMSMSSAMNMFKMMMCVESGDAEALYDSSVPFQKFLKKQGLDDLLRKLELKLRTKHTIVPHRILSPLNGNPSDLPVFPDDDSWYYNTKLTSFTFSERYVEFMRA